MEQFWADRERALRIVGYVSASTLVITASFVGVIAVLSGSIGGFTDRLPVYVLLTAGIFVALMFFLDNEGAPGMQVLLSTASMGILTFVIVSLAGEGLRYAILRPAKVLSSQLFFYITAAALFCTGLGYWALNHWRELAADEATPGP